MTHLSERHTPRIPQQLPGDDLRLALQLRFMHAVPPFRLIASTHLDGPAPWLHPHYQVSQLLRAGPPACPATVLSASRILPLGALPLAAQGLSSLRCN